MTIPSEINVAIIGAGAAGLGAAHALRRSRLSCIVLEARERIGGRGYTIMAAPDVVFDVGCGWLHSANRNSFVKIAEAKIKCLPTSYRRLWAADRPRHDDDGGGMRIHPAADL